MRYSPLSSFEGDGWVQNLAVSEGWGIQHQASSEEMLIPTSDGSLGSVKVYPFHGQVGFN